MIRRSSSPSAAPSAARAAARALTATVAALVLVGLGAGAAQAHNTVRSTDPADGSTVTVVPATLTLTFDQPATAIGTEIVVLAPDGRAVSVGEPVLVDASVSQAIEGELPAGTYTVQWRVTSADGHPLSGELTFTAAEATTIGVEPIVEPDPEPDVTANAEPEEAEPSPDVTATDVLDGPVTAEPEKSSSTPLVIAVLAALLAAGVVAVAVRRRGR